MGKVVIELIPFYFVAIGILRPFSFVPALTLRIQKRAKGPVGFRRQVAGPAVAHIP